MASVVSVLLVSLLEFPWLLSSGKPPGVAIEKEGFGHGDASEAPDGSDGKTSSRCRTKFTPAELRHNRPHSRTFCQSCLYFASWRPKLVHSPTIHIYLSTDCPASTNKPQPGPD